MFINLNKNLITQLNKIWSKFKELFSIKIYLLIICTMQVLKVHGKTR